MHAQSCPAFGEPMDCSPPGSSVHGIFRQEYWSDLPFPSLGDVPNPGIELTSAASPPLAGRFFTPVPLGKPWRLERWPEICATKSLSFLISAAAGTQGLSLQGCSSMPSYFAFQFCVPYPNILIPEGKNMIGLLRSPGVNISSE